MKTDIFIKAKEYCHNNEKGLVCLLILKRTKFMLAFGTIMFITERVGLIIWFWNNCKVLLIGRIWHLFRMDGNHTKENSKMEGWKAKGSWSFLMESIIKDNSNQEWFMVLELLALLMARTFVEVGATEFFKNLTETCWFFYTYCYQRGPKKFLVSPSKFGLFAKNEFCWFNSVHHL